MRTIATGLVYRNPRPEVRSVNAWHPSLLRLSDGRLLCSFDLGQAPESHDYNTYLSWSADDAATWSEPHPLRPPTTSGRPSTYSVRIGRLRDGTLTAFGARHFRDDPAAGLINHPSIGFTPMELVLFAKRRWWSCLVTDGDDRGAARGSGLRGLPSGRGVAGWALVGTHIDLARMGRRHFEGHEGGRARLLRSRSLVARLADGVR